MDIRREFDLQRQLETSNVFSRLGSFSKGSDSVMYGERDSSSSYDSAEFRGNDLFRNDDIVTINAYDMFSMEITLQSKEIELWELAQNHREELEDNFKEVLHKHLGAEISFKFSFYKGSWKARLIGWCKNAWEKSGKRIKNAIDRIRPIVINTKELVAELQQKVGEMVKKYYPAVKKVVIKTWEVVEVTARVISALNTIVGFMHGFGLDFDDWSDWGYA